MDNLGRALDRIEKKDIVTLEAEGNYQIHYTEDMRSDSIMNRCRREMAIQLADELIKNNLIEFFHSIDSTPIGNSIRFRAKLKVESPYNKIKFIY